VEVLEAVEASELPRVDRLTSARHRDGGFSYVAAMSLRMTSCLFKGVRTSVMFALPTEADMLSARIDVC